MNTLLCITVRFLQPLSHGRGDGGEPEWPPSPLRLFQALVSAAAARWNERLRVEYAVPLLEWLAERPAPMIVAALGTKSDVRYRLYVPDNVGDKVAGAWRRGSADASIADYRTEKDVRPTHLIGDAVHYLYPITDSQEFAKHRDALVATARSITHLGWGVDVVVGNAEEISAEEVAKLPGERWSPATDRSGTQLRVPRRDENNPQRDTLRALMEKHSAFLGRLSADGFRPVPPLTAFKVVGYRRETDVTRRPSVVFELHRPINELAELSAGQSRFRPFDPVQTPRFARTSGAHDPCGAVVVAGMVRHVVANALTEQGWPEERVLQFVHGHDGSGEQATTDNRLMFLPLPSITPLRVESIRRVLIAGPPGEDLTRVRQLLNGRELVPLQSAPPVAMLAVGSPSEPTVERYLRSSRAWSTVTPVVLPGYDDPDGIRRRLRQHNPERAMSAEEQGRLLSALNHRTQSLLLRAFGHAGIGSAMLSAESLERGESELEWREVGFRPGVDLAQRYALSRPQFPRYHVRVRFAHPVRGPLAVGAGRYRGLGLFAAEGD